MLRRRVTVAVILALLIVTCSAAQTIKIDEPKQLTFVLVGNDYAHTVATNGTEWGVAYVRYDDTRIIHFVKTSFDGQVLESHALYQDEEDTYGYRAPKIAAYPKGWAITYEYRAETANRPSRYFALLDKRGRKTGSQAVIAGEQYSDAVAPIWVGSMFVLFYENEDDDGNRELWVAYLDDEAKRIVPDRMVMDFGQIDLHIASITPTSNGFAVIGNEESIQGFIPYYCLVSLDGEVIRIKRNLTKNIVPFTVLTALWNGSGYAIGGYETPENAAVAARPAVRMLSDKGRWQGGLFRQTAHGEYYMHGVGFTGSGYISVALNYNNATVYCQQLNNALKAVGQAQIVNDSNRAESQNVLIPIGGDAHFFASLRIAGYSKSSNNIYYTRIRSMHSGKPAITFFNGVVQEFDGKKYVLFDWHAAGCETVKMKTKGGRWTLPASGFHAVELSGNNKVRFKVIASNDAGRSKAKVKITP